jgi:hypothetical protein
LGEFLDALKAGQQAKQNRIADAQEKSAAAQQVVQDQVKADRKWVSDVLEPVAAEISNDLTSVGKVAINDASSVPYITVKNITIALNGRKPTTLSFHVQKGAITAYQDGSQGNTIGAITTVGQPQIREVFRKTLKSLGEA